ncbi:hypothetical protein V2G26_010588 [Clonostachys chloroleuca]|uniref:DUF7136 domain-containing protein n=1 Tax=Clonostachys chloroleuca TaxID=1926264 RepID=A0AA35QF72_9HYPO|nr:unnamed protein product [Clonostachys chloroleuca]
MRLPALVLLAAGSAWGGSMANWNITLDVAFPGNSTYKNETDFPVVFALHNAAVAFQYGFTINWEIAPIGSNSKPKQALASGSIKEDASTHKPINATNNIWYPADSAGNTTSLPSGPYLFSWHWSMRSCREQDVQITIDPAASIANGSIGFTLADDGAQLDLTKDCPTGQSQVTIEAAEPSNDIMASCPYIKITKSSLPDPCQAKLSASSWACVKANITGVGDTKGCPSLKEINSTTDGDGTETSTTSSASPSSTSSSSSDTGGVAAVIPPSAAGTCAVLLSVAGALLIL